MPRSRAVRAARFRCCKPVGMGFSNFIALAIMVTAAATLDANNVTDIQTSAQAAQALRPIAGSLAETIFALGVIGTGLLSVRVLAGSPAFRRLLGEQRSFLGASDRERRAFCRDRPEAIEFGAAELGRCRRFAAATAPDRAGIKRHRVVAGADREMPGGISHRSHNFL